MQRVLEAAHDYATVTRRIVESALGVVPAAEGCALLVAEGEELVFVAGAGSLVQLVGHSIGLHASLAGLAVLQDETLTCEDSANDSRVDHVACLCGDAVSLICVPLRRGAGALGVLAVAATQPGAFSHGDVDTLKELSDFVAAVLAAARDLNRSLAMVLGEDGRDRSADPSALSRFVSGVVSEPQAGQDERRQRIRDVLEHRRLSVRLQPIVHLGTMRLAGAEMLARVDVQPSRSPDEWFADARAVGLGEELQLLAVDVALKAAAHLPAPAFVSINVGADGLASGAVRSLLADCPRELVIELTDDAPVTDYPRLRGALDPLRNIGVRVAIDDAGGGPASLSHIVKIQPDLIKLDIELLSGIERDPVRRSLVTAVVAFASEIGSDVVAEGIEREEELEVLTDLGVDFGQGCLLGEPMTVSEFASRTRSLWAR